MSTPLVFSGSPLDRADLRRRDGGWLEQRLAEEETRILPLWRLDPLVRADGPRLAWATPALMERLAEPPEPLFLGIAEERAHFAVDLSGLAQPLRQLELEGIARFADLRAVAASLPAGEAAIAALARHLIDWHGRHGYCPGCGNPTEPRAAGWVRVCADCSTEHFPRTDPVAIMLVLREGRCLLGRQTSWPSPFFSALAGFVEPGETLEEAVRREVAEEAGIEVGRVQYLASQPWPFPASLMLGCLAEGRSEAIQIDGREIAEAAWFTREQVKAALAGDSTSLGVPPPLAIAHHLLRAWALDGRELD